MNKNNSIKDSFRNAFAGLLIVWKEENNVRIETIIGILALFLGFLFRISKFEMLIILLCCMIVLSLEFVNSALEAAVDYTGVKFHELAGKAKDIAAGAVLLASIFSVIIGLFIFIPYIVDLIEKIIS